MEPYHQTTGILNNSRYRKMAWERENRKQLPRPSSLTSMSSLRSKFKTIDSNSWLPLLSYHSPSHHELFTIFFSRSFVLSSQPFSSLFFFLHFALFSFFLINFFPPFLCLCHRVAAICFSLLLCSFIFFFFNGVLFIFMGRCWKWKKKKKTGTTLTLCSFLVHVWARPSATVCKYSFFLWYSAWGRGSDRWIVDTLLHACFILVICMREVESCWLEKKM